MNTPVVYVEDEEDDVFFMQHAWKRLGIEHPLTVFTDGEQGAAYLTRLPPETLGSATPARLVFLDLNLPRKSGFELLKEFRTRYDKATIPVVVLSSSDAAKDRERSRELGANAYHIKPSRIDGWIQLLQEIKGDYLNC